MATDLRRILISLLVVVGVAVPLYHAVAYDINDIVQVRINEDTAKRVCQAQGVLDGIKAIQNGYLKQAVKDTINELKKAVTTYAFQFAICALLYEDKTLKIPFVGDVIIKAPNCDFSFNSDMSALLKRQTLDKIKNDFMARCIANGALKKMENDIRQMIQENGPDGEPAYVTDWMKLQVDADAQAVNRFNAILVNTAICPYFRDAVYSYFNVPRSYIENPPALTGLGMRSDGQDSFVQRGNCTVPDGVTPDSLTYDFMGYGGFDSLAMLMQDQNNPQGFIAMAGQELAQQRALAVSAAVNEAVAGGGFTGSYGDSTQSCLNRDPNGKCLARGPVKLPAGAVRDGNAATLQAEFDWVVSAQGMNTLMGDVRQRLASMFLSLDSKALDYDITFDASSQDYRDIGNGVKPPESIDTAPELPDSGGGGGPPGTTCGSTTDQECTGGNPQCFCARNCPQFSQIREFVKQATLQACNANPDLVTDQENCGSLAPNIQGRVFLDAVCNTQFGLATGCHVNGDSDDEIVINGGGGGTLSLDLITAEGVIRLPGQTVAACEAGVQ